METGGVNRGSSNRISVYPRCVGTLAKTQHPVIAACGIDSYAETTAALRGSKPATRARSARQDRLPSSLACGTARKIISN